MTLEELIATGLPKSVWFDLDNTFYSYEIANNAGMVAAYEKLNKLFSINHADAESLFAEARKQIKKLLDGTGASHSRLLYFQRMLELMGLKTQPSLILDLEQTFWRAYIQNAVLFDGVEDFLYKLRSKDIVTAIVTDLTAQIQMRKLIYLGMDSLIDFIVTSEEVGADKPNKRIYEVAAQKTGFTGKDVWMIGDDIAKDIKAAQEFGLHAILKADKNIKTDIPYFTNFANLTKQL